ncbi:MAG: chemotaxis protein CheW [Myxococcales bacterium]
MTDATDVYEELLDRRARALAAPPVAAGARTLLARVALVAVGTEKLGIPVAGMREIVRTPPVASLPGLPAHLAGVTQNPRRAAGRGPPGPAPGPGRRRPAALPGGARRRRARRRPAGRRRLGLP